MQSAVHAFHQTGTGGQVLLLVLEGQAPAVFSRRAGIGRVQSDGHMRLPSGLGVLDAQHAVLPQDGRAVAQNVDEHAVQHFLIGPDRSGIAAYVHLDGLAFQPVGEKAQGKGQGGGDGTGPQLGVQRSR